MPKLLINVSQRQAFSFAIFLVMYEFLTYIANDMIMPGMISVVASFHGSESTIATSLTAYMMGGASLQLLLGPLSDRYGRRPVMLFGAMFFFFCTVFIACSWSMGQFLVARFFQGMGLGFIGVVGYATLQEIFAEMDAIRLIAIMANVSILAPLLGPLLGAIVIHYMSWRMIFVAIGAGALVALWGLWRFMPESVGQMKSDGTEIKRMSFSPRAIFDNYKVLFLNPSFMLGSIALGVLGIPCLAWIALAPIILVTNAHLSVIEYSFWQIPVFGACILGNVFLHRMTHHRSVNTLIWIGSITSIVSLLLTLIVPLVMGHAFLWLMPGLIVYFFGLGVTGAPLSRFILFSTSVSKGTASALMSMVSMCIQGGGIELANIFYRTHNNGRFGLYCALMAMVYALVMGLVFFAAKQPPIPIDGS